MNRDQFPYGVQLFVVRAKQAENKKSNAALWIALIIHFVGLIGMLFVDRYRFIVLTPINLLIMAGLLLQTHNEKSYRPYIFFLVCWVTGMMVELLGVHTGLLFGDYRYGKWLGPAFRGVPLIIGVNWFMIVYCSAALVSFMLRKSLWLRKTAARLRINYKLFFIVAGALCATIFDWVMEPAAIELGFWIWKMNVVPFWNYVCWFLVSAALLGFFVQLRLSAVNRFAVQLFFIQLVFFILIKLFA